MNMLRTYASTPHRVRTVLGTCLLNPCNIILHGILLFITILATGMSLHGCKGKVFVSQEKGPHIQGSDICSKEKARFIAPQTAREQALYRKHMTEKDIWINPQPYITPEERQVPGKD